MKKYVCSLAFLIILTGLTLAQPFSGGFFAGVSFSQVDGDTYAGYHKPGLTAGAYITRKFNLRTGWKAELRYIQKGAYNKGPASDPSFYKLTLHYVELPLMVQYFVNEHVILDAGLAPEVYIFHREENQDGELREQDYPPFHHFGLGADGGVYYKFNEHIITGARYSYSLLPIRQHASGQTYHLNRGQYSNVLSFTLYYEIK